MKAWQEFYFAGGGGKAYTIYLFEGGVNRRGCKDVELGLLWTVKELPGTLTLTLEGDTPN